MAENKIRILVVDDDVEFRQTLTEILEDEGYEVIPVGKGREAVAEARKRFCNIVIMDIKLSDMSGADVLKAIMEINENTIVIVSSGFVSEEALADVINKGAYAYICKPFDIDEALAIIKKSLESRAGRGG